MSQEVCQAALCKETHQLLQGPLKHVKGAALAAALVPLASIAASPAQAQSMCASAGTVCGFVWYDANNNGIQDGGEAPIEGVKMALAYGSDILETETGPDGFYYFWVDDGTYTIAAVVPQGMQPSPFDTGSDDTMDSDGVPDGMGNSVAKGVVVVNGNNTDTDFGFWTPPAQQPPGTGTPGYWKNHPEAWPVTSITVGGVTYTMDEAISWLRRVGKDKTTTMFSSLVPAMLNVLVGNDESCVASTIEAANDWMASYGPVGSGVPASSAAWEVGEPLHRHLDNYNNGRLCAPHRQ
jgi:hypothetical protein